jgi:uroporphyrinogen decarboxylase
MDHRERVLRAISFEKPDRVPFNFWMDRRRMSELEERYGAQMRIRHYGADILESYVPLAWPAGQFEQKAGTPWLVKPLIDDWRKAKDIPLPDPNVDGLYDYLRNDLKENPDVAVILDLPNVLTYIETMLSQEQLYVDMMDYEEEIQAFFHRMSDIMQRAAEVICKMDITALYVMDDIGCNKGLIISPAMWKRCILPHWRKPIEVAHAHGKPVFFHTDGNVQLLWEEFAKLGVRMLNPLQPDIQPIPEFKKQYFGRIGIYGGLPTDKIHTMTLKEIEIMVQDLFEKAGQGGGLVMSTHDIDITVTDEQLDAFTGAICNCTYA